MCVSRTLEMPKFISFLWCLKRNMLINLIFTRHDEFLNFFMSSNYHIICMTKTWFRSEVSDIMIELPGFSLLRWDRTSRHGSGVTFYYCSCLRASLLTCSQVSCSGRPEFFITEVRFEFVSNLLLDVAYRPPNTGYLHKFPYLQNQSLELQVNYGHSIIFNDFNADMLINTYDNKVKKFHWVSKFILLFSLSLYIFIYNNNNNTLYYIYTYKFVIDV